MSWKRQSPATNQRVRGYTPRNIMRAMMNWGIATRLMCEVGPRKEQIQTDAPALETCEMTLSQ